MMEIMLEKIVQKEILIEVTGKKTYLIEQTVVKLSVSLIS